MIVIAGPCSVETEAQVRNVADFLSRRGDVYAMRGGIWKPRSSAGGFEGVGEIGLRWLREAKNEFGIRIATEVGNAKHVEMALKYGIDMMWIGARSTVNPFYVREIAEAMRGVDVEVMVKNPVNPDLKLWIGAIERLEKVGVRSISAIHRGFSTYGETIYRNSPLWEIPIELKRLKPETPVLIDPSHIAGNREFIDALVKTALNYQLDGIMVEVHDDPDKAWSDRKQQLSFSEFGKLMECNSHTFSSVNNAPEIIEKLRQQIDNIDDELIELLRKRMEISEKIGVIKMEEDMPILQLNRWDYILKDRLMKADRLSLSSDFIKSVFDVIHIESLKTQNNLRIEKQ